MKSNFIMTAFIYILGYNTKTCFGVVMKCQMYQDKTLIYIQGGTAIFSTAFMNVLQRISQCWYFKQTITYRFSCMRINDYKSLLQALACSLQIFSNSILPRTSTCRIVQFRHTKQTTTQSCNFMHICENLLRFSSFSLLLDFPMSTSNSTIYQHFRLILCKYCTVDVHISCDTVSVHTLDFLIPASALVSYLLAESTADHHWVGAAYFQINGLCMFHSTYLN